MKIGHGISFKKISSLFINRNFAFLWIGQAISNLGDFTFTTALILWIGTAIAPKQSWAPLAVGGVLAIAAVPALLLGPIAGVFADRWDKRRTMLSMDVIRAIFIGILVLVSGSIPLPFLPTHQLSISWQLAAIYIAVFLVSICTQYFTPARFALGAEVVDEPQRARASGLGQLTANLALLMGPPLGTLLFFTIGVQWVLLLNAFSFVISFLTIYQIQLPSIKSVGDLPSKNQSRFLFEFLDGLRIFSGNTILQTIMFSMFLVLFSGGVSESLNLFFIIQNLHVNSSYYGILSTASGVGLLIGAVLASWGTEHIGITRAFWLGIMMIGLLEMVYARSTNVFFALVILFLQGIPNAVINAAMGPLVMKVTPQTHMGRVLALLIPTMTLATMISTLLAGNLVSTVLHTFHTTVLGLSFGPIDTAIMGAGLVTFTGGLYAMVKLQKA